LFGFVSGDAKLLSMFDFVSGDTKCGCVGGCGSLFCCSKIKILHFVTYILLFILTVLFGHTPEKSCYFLLYVLCYALTPSCSNFALKKRKRLVGYGFLRY
jgi:hypothetical protein